MVEITLALLKTNEPQRTRMVKRDTFDYTEWQRKLWEGKSIEEIHALAAKHEQKRISGTLD